MNNPLSVDHIAHACDALVLHGGVVPTVATMQPLTFEILKAELADQAYFQPQKAEFFVGAYHLHIIVDPLVSPMEIYLSAEPWVDDVL